MSGWPIPRRVGMIGWRSTTPIALQGLRFVLNDVPYPFRDPAFVGPGEHVRLWADKGSSVDHLAFKLPLGGATMLLLDATGNEIDKIFYGPQSEGVSEGRLPDGGTNIVSFPVSPSPGEVNFIPLE